MKFEVTDPTASWWAAGQIVERAGEYNFVVNAHLYKDAAGNRQYLRTDQVKEIKND